MDAAANAAPKSRGRLVPRGTARAVAGWLVSFAAVTVAPVRGDSIAPRFPDGPSFEQSVEEGRMSPFGIDYVFVHSPAARDRQLVDRVCAEVAIRWVNFARLQWSTIEKRPPKNGVHTYDWSDMGRAVQAWRRNASTS